jgi:chromosomal replication initiation ATPase DnaA
MSLRQLAFDLDRRPALGREDFLLAPGNRDAVSWMERWRDWPNRAFALYGAEGCGKTHLVHLWQGVAGAEVLDAGALGTADLPALAGRPVAVEDGDRGVPERALLHLLNLARESGGYVLLTGRDAPARWAVALPDLRSRLAAIAAVAIAPADEALLGALLVKLFADRQLRVGDGVIPYLLARMERSCAAAQKLVAELDRAAMAEQRPIGLALVRDVLDAAAGETAKLL